jgi:hypothetical protein
MDLAWLWTRKSRNSGTGRKNLNLRKNDVKEYFQKMQLFFGEGSYTVC